jgi:hypothetical protein
MESTNDGSLDQTTLTILFRCVRQGLPLTEVCADLQLEVHAVFRALSERANIQAKTLEIALRMRENGKSLERISDLCEVPIASLLKILPGQETDEKSIYSQAQLSRSIDVRPISEAEAVGVSSTEPARQELPKKRRIAPSSASTTVSKRCSDGKKKGNKKVPSDPDYQGQLLNGKPHGYGRKQYAYAGVYVGGWVKGKRHGQGVLNSLFGDRYEGEWEYDNRHGQGTQTAVDGRVYTGSWKNDKKHGHGVYTWPDGARYEGEFKNDMRHGQGTETDAYGYVYSGSWKDDKLNGHGVETWPDGERYEGEYKNEKKHGQGTRTEPNGRVYTGSWKSSQMHGHGVKVEPDGGRYIGTWDEDKKHGEFTYSKGGISRREKWTAGVLGRQ